MVQNLMPKQRPPASGQTLPRAKSVFCSIEIRNISTCSECQDAHSACMSRRRHFQKSLRGNVRCMLMWRSNLAVGGKKHGCCQRACDVRYQAPLNDSGECGDRTTPTTRTLPVRDAIYFSQMPRQRQCMTVPMHLGGSCVVATCLCGASGLCQETFPMNPGTCHSSSCPACYWSHGDAMARNPHGLRRMNTRGSVDKSYQSLSCALCSGKTHPFVHVYCAQRTLHSEGLAC